MANIEEISYQMTKLVWPIPTSMSINDTLLSNSNLPSWKHNAVPTQSSSMYLPTGKQVKVVY